MEETPELAQQWADRIDHNEVPHVYFQHPVAQRSGNTAIPIAVYLDGVPYSQVDSTTGFWIINLVSMRRHFCVAWRKRLSCRLEFPPISSRGALIDRVTIRSKYS